MSKNHDQSADHPDEFEADQSASDKAQGQNYAIGYGKPPTATRFRKGQSGNPSGRPRKPKAPRPIRLSDALFDKFLEQEAYRSATVRENGQVFQLPMVQIALRDLATGAAKGNRLKQKALLKLVAESEERHFAEKEQYYHHLAALKRRGEEQIAYHKRNKLPPPTLLPHPDDIVLIPAMLEAYVDGPKTEEEVRRCEDGIAVRNWYLLCAAHAGKTCTGSKAQFRDDVVHFYDLCAATIDQHLPKRFRLDERDFVSLINDYKSLSKSERKKLISVEFTRLNEAIPDRHNITAKVERLIKHRKEQLLKRAQPHASSH